MFVENAQFDSSTIPAFPAAAAEGEPAVAPVPGVREVHSQGHADSEHDDGEPPARRQRQVPEVQSLIVVECIIYPRTLHAKCGRMYRKKALSKRHDPLRDPGEVPAVERFGHRNAIDFTLV